jgi:hypothetical protein
MSTQITYTSDGVTTSFPITFPLLVPKSHVNVYVDGDAVGFNWSVDGLAIEINPAPTSGLIVKLERETPSIPLVSFKDGSSLFGQDLDRVVLQSLYLAAEGRDQTVFLDTLLRQAEISVVELTNLLAEFGELDDLLAVYAAENPPLLTTDILGAYNRSAPDKPCAIVKKGDTFELYSPLTVSGFWARDTLERSSNAMRRPTTRSVISFADIYHVGFDNFTTVGTFTWYPNSDAVGGVYANVSNANAYVEYTVEVDGTTNMLQAITAKRNSCNHISVTINGGTELVNLLPTNTLGEKYIDGYIAGSVPVVNNYTAIAVVPKGSYTIRLQLSSIKNDLGVAPNRMYAQGLAVVGGTAGLPLGARTHAPLWVSGESVEVSYQRWYEGVTYRATTQGITVGSSPLDDTAVTWVEVSDTYAIYSEEYLRDVSEPTWAVWLAMDGNTEEDFGGDIHGGINLSNTTLLLNNYPVTLTDYLPLYGDSIEVIQEGIGYHSASPEVPIFTATMTYNTLAGGDFGYRNQLKFLTNGFMGAYYPAMLPLYHYNVAENFRYQLRRATVQGASASIPSDYYGQTNPQQGNTTGLQLLGLVDVKSPKGSGGIPHTDTQGEFTLAVSLEVTAPSLLSFELDGARAFWDMNTGSADPTLNGYIGLLCKGYFCASDGTIKKPIVANETLTVDGIYRVRMSRGSAGEP